MRYICTAVMATLVLVSTSAADIINVPGDYATIQAAVNAASNGDIIAIDAGNYNGNAQVEDVSLSLIGATNSDGSPAVVITGSIDFADQGNKHSTVANIRCKTMTLVDCTVTVSNCTIEDGQDNAAGLVLAHFQGALEECRIANCHAEFLPGGVYITDQFEDMQIPTTDAVFIDCVIESNSGSCPFPGCGGKAGVTLENGNVDFVGCTIRDNTASGQGGITVSSLSTASFTDTRVCGNSSTGQIFGMWIDNGGNCIQDSCDECADCLGDLDGNGEVGVDDLLALLSAFQINDGGDCDNDGDTDVNDLLTLIAAWGPCP